ncbi:MAG: O-antigen ligase family protein [Verrucomicrobiota bacterium]
MKWDQTGFALLIVSLGFAVFAFGATSPGPQWIAHGLVCLTSLTLFIQLIITRRLSSLFTRRLISLGLPILLLVAQGLFMIVNAKSDHSMLTWEFESLKPALSDKLPGSEVRSASREAVTLHVGTLTLLLLLVAHIRSKRQLLLIARTIALIGVVFAVVGLTQKAIGLRSIYGLSETGQGMFFGSYRSHTNAGSLILMTWPFCMALFLIECSREFRSKRWIALWGIGSLLLTVSLFVNQSRAAQAIGLLTFSLFLWMSRRELRSSFAWGRGRWEQRVIKLLAGAIILLTVLITLHQVSGRWSQFATSRYWPPTNTVRWQAWEVEWKMVQDAGWFGLGPGAFKHLFPYYTHDAGDDLAGRWFHAHQDYLQILMEWGSLGALCWSAILFGGWLLSTRRLFQGNTPLDRAIWTATTAILLHMLVDFPFHIYSLQLLLLVTLAMAWGRKIPD